MEAKEAKNDISDQWMNLFNIIIKEDFLPKELTIDFFVKVYKKMEPIFITYKFGENMWMKYHYIVQEMIKILKNEHCVWLMTDFTNIPNCLKGKGVYGTNFIDELTNGSFSKQYENTLIPNNDVNGVRVHIDIENVLKVNLEMIEKKLWKMFVKQYDPHGLVYKTYVMSNSSIKCNYHSQIQSCRYKGGDCKECK